MITGTSGVVGVVADPVSHLRTPQMFNELMSQRGLDVVAVPMHVAAGDLPVFFEDMRAQRNVLGLVVSVPHKEAVVRLCQQLTPAASRVSAVNVIRFDEARAATGTNTDGEGFVAGLKAHGVRVEGQSVYIAGAGGAAKAIAEALLQAGAGRLGICNRSEARARDLVTRLKADHAGVDVHVAAAAPEDYSLAINATSLGLKPDDPLPFSLDRLPVSAIVAEVVMKTEITPLLDAARQRGNSIHLGRHMLEGQILQIAQFLGATSEA